jgi:large subunit ribosomal protein L5
MAKDDEKGEAKADAPKKDKPASAKQGTPRKKAAEPTGPAPKYKREQQPRMKQLYLGTVRGALTKDFNYGSAMEVPRVVKVSLNMGLGRAAHDAKIIDFAVEELKAISGQAPVVSKAKKDIANYKLRKGHKIGVMVTLRGDRMWEFLDRLVNIALPRVRDFRGVSSKGFDGRGNYTLGVREQIIFPEIEFDKIDQIKGLNISIVTTAKTDNEGRALLAHLGMPFRQAPVTEGARAPGAAA